MQPTFIGVRHHSPACARLVRDTVRALRPKHVLIEGPADMNDRIGELYLGHQLPVAVFTSYRDEQRHHASWSPLCAHSPEWVALAEGRDAGAQVRFIDLPAWHPALAERANRYSDAERRYTDAVERLCAHFAVDNTDTLWDHLFEIGDSARIAERSLPERADNAAELEAYFDLVRGDADASDEDTTREAYMASWVAAAVADAGARPVVVVTGGFHRPALVARTADAVPADWPEVPAFPENAVGGSYLVPYSFRRLDAFTGYQSGMPSPRYYQRLWEAGPEAAGRELLSAVVHRLRDRKVPTSTASLVAARTLSVGLARLRGHAAPARTDILDGLVSALVTDALETPLPWTGRGPLTSGTDPVVVEMVAALSGDAVGRLHPDTPHPPLVADIEAELERHAIPEHGELTLDLTTDTDLRRSRVLHRLRCLRVTGFERRSGPAPGRAPALREEWTLRRGEHWLSELIEAGSFGATLDAAAAAALTERFTDTDPVALANVLFDAVLCGLDAVSAQVLAVAAKQAGAVTDLAGLGTLLGTVLGLWRHDRLLGARDAPVLAAVVDAATTRALWLVEGIRGGPAPADDGRLRAVVAVRDAALHAAPVLQIGIEAVAAVFTRCTAADRPPDLRGASVGMTWTLLPPNNPTPERQESHFQGVRRLESGFPGIGEAAREAVRGAARPDTLGDFLAGLFAVAREQVLADGEIIGLLDDVLGELPEDDFLVALPALRLAFSWFPPRERETIAGSLLERRGLRGSARALLRLTADTAQLAHARALETRVDALLTKEGLLDG